MRLLLPPASPLGSCRRRLRRPSAGGRPAACVRTGRHSAPACLPALPRRRQPSAHTAHRAQQVQPHCISWNTEQKKECNRQGMQMPPATTAASSHPPLPRSSDHTAHQCSFHPPVRAGAAPASGPYGQWPGAWQGRHTWPAACASWPASVQSMKGTHRHNQEGVSTHNCCNTGLGRQCYMCTQPATKQTGSHTCNAQQAYSRLRVCAALAAAQFLLPP